MVTPKIEELINNHESNESKIQLSMGVNFINVRGEENTCTFYVKSDNDEIRLSSNTSNVITKLFNTILNNYQNEEQILRNGRNYIFESVDVLNVDLHKIDLKERQLVHQFSQIDKKGQL